MSPTPYVYRLAIERLMMCHCFVLAVRIAAARRLNVVTRTQVLVIFTSIVIQLTAVLRPVGAVEPAAPLVDFQRQIRPILSDNCYHCHGPDAEDRQADLRLDTREGALADLGGHAALVPGNSQQSELWTRMLSSDADERMPPPDSGKQLKPEQIELVRRWIEQGADWSVHWSLEPPQRKPAQAIDQQPHDSHWGQNEIDPYILARLTDEGLSPSPKADRRTLIRRLTLDLTGLPPSSQEIHAFLEDQQPGAYERLVERLLASPHYGERMALAWLDFQVRWHRDKRHKFCRHYWMQPSQLHRSQRVAGHTH